MFVVCMYVNLGCVAGQWLQVKVVCVDLQLEVSWECSAAATPETLSTRRVGVLLTQSFSHCCMYHELFRAEVIHAFSPDVEVFLGRQNWEFCKAFYEGYTAYFGQPKSCVFGIYSLFSAEILRNSSLVSSQNKYILLVITVYYLALLIINKDPILKRQ